MIPNGVAASAAPLTTLAFTAGTQNLGGPVGRVWWNGERFWCARGGLVYYSYDGLNWTDSACPAAASLGGDVFSNGNFGVFTGGTTTTAYMWNETTDAWVTFTLPWSTTWTSLAWGQNRYLAGHRISNTMLATSTDLVTWSEVSTASMSGGQYVLFHKDWWIVDPYADTSTVPHYRRNLLSGEWNGGAGNYSNVRPYVSGGKLWAGYTLGTLQGYVDANSVSWSPIASNYYIADGEIGFLAAMTTVGSATQYKLNGVTITGGPGCTNQYFCWGRGMVVFSSDQTGTANHFTYVGRPV